jgi:hypothetical protein
VAVPDDSDVVDALWALLEADVGVTAAVRVGNRLKLSTDAGWLRDLFVNRAPADFPLVKIDVGDFSYTGFTQDQTFGTESNVFDPATARWPMQHDCDFVITTESVDPKLGAPCELEAAVVRALLKSGPHLGLDYVAGYTFRGRRKASKDRGAWRRRTDLRVSVRMQFKGEDFFA